MPGLQDDATDEGGCLSICRACGICPTKWLSWVHAHVLRNVEPVLSRNAEMAADVQKETMGRIERSSQPSYDAINGKDGLERNQKSAMQSTALICGGKMRNN
jgi:hypothetical protein